MWNGQKEAASANELYAELTWIQTAMSDKDASTAYSGPNSSQGYF